MITSDDIEANGIQWFMIDEFRPNRIRPATPAILNTDTSDRSGQHWIVVVRLRRMLYVVDSLGPENKRYTSDGKSVTDRVLRSFGKVHYYKHAVQQRSDVLCGFHAIYVAKFLREYLQEHPNAGPDELDNVVDDHYITHSKKSNDGDAAKANARIIAEAFS